MRMHVSVDARVHECVSMYQCVCVHKCSHVPVSGRGLGEWLVCRTRDRQGLACSGAGCRLASMPQEISRWRERATVRLWVREASGLFTRWP